MVKEMKYTVVEDFIKANPDFHVYLADPVNRKFGITTVSNDIDFNKIEEAYVIKSNNDFITLVDVKENDVEIYKVI